MDQLEWRQGIPWPDWMTSAASVPVPPHQAPGSAFSTTINTLHPSIYPSKWPLEQASRETHLWQLTACAAHDAESADAEFLKPGKPWTPRMIAECVLDDVWCKKHSFRVSHKMSQSDEWLMSGFFQAAQLPSWCQRWTAATWIHVDVTKLTQLPSRKWQNLYRLELGQEYFKPDSISSQT